MVPRAPLVTRVLLARLDSRARRGLPELRALRALDLRVLRALLVTRVQPALPVTRVPLGQPALPVTRGLLGQLGLQALPVTRAVVGTKHSGHCRKLWTS